MGFHLLNQYFDKVYVVTIPRSYESRKDKLKKNLQGIDYSLFMGVDGREIKSDSLETIYDSNKAKSKFSTYLEKAYGINIERDLSLSEIGCALSHKKIYSEVIEKGYQKVLILEDDAKLDLKFAYAVEKILNEIPGNCDLLYWGYRWYDSESKLSRLTRIFFKTPLHFIFKRFVSDPQNEHFPKKHSKYIMKAGFHAGTHAYSITNKAALKLLEENTPICFCADQLFQELYVKKQLNCFVTFLPIIREDQTMQSSIVEKKK